MFQVNIPKLLRSVSSFYPLALVRVTDVPNQGMITLHLSTTMAPRDIFVKVKFKTEPFAG